MALAPGASKEVHYFEQFLIRPLPPGAAAGYSRHFPRPPGSLAGEWTPRYMHDVWTPPLLQQLAPAARLLVMLRDPVDRYRSGCAHELAKAGAAPLQFVAGDAFARGLYHLQLQRLLRHFGRGDVLVLQFEACLRSTARELTRTFAFLGLEDDVTVPARAVARVNAAVGGKPPLADGLRAALVDAYRNDVDRLLGSFPEIDGDLWPNMCSSASRKP